MSKDHMLSICEVTQKPASEKNYFYTCAIVQINVHFSFKRYKSNIFDMTSHSIIHNMFIVSFDIISSFCVNNAFSLKKKKVSATLYILYI